MLELWPYGTSFPCFVMREHIRTCLMHKLSWMTHRVTIQEVSLCHRTHIPQHLPHLSLSKSIQLTHLCLSKFIQLTHLGLSKSKQLPHLSLYRSKQLSHLSLSKSKQLPHPSLPKFIQLPHFSLSTSKQVLHLTPNRYLTQKRPNPIEYLIGSCPILNRQLT